MRWIRFFPLFFVIFLLISPSHAYVHYVTRSTEYFHSKKYGTFFTLINFDSSILPLNFSTLYRGSNQYWYFNDYGFQVENANMTITKFFESNQLGFTVSASSGTSTSRIYCPTKGEPYNVTGASTWGYDPVIKILTITVQHSSDKQVLVNWNFPSPPPSNQTYGWGQTEYYDVTVKVTLNNIPVSLASVNVEDEDPQETNATGQTTFRLSEGTHIINATYNDETQSKTVLVNQDMTVGFNFSSFLAFTRPFWIVFSIVLILLATFYYLDKKQKR